MLAVVMAGGKGTRLRPLTCDKPKPMVPVANRPLLEHVVRLLVREGWNRIAFTLHYLPDKVQAYFGDGARFGTQLHYFVEDQPLGTAGSVRMADGLVDGTVLVASGDALCDFDLRAALAFHRERRAAVTILLTRVATPLEYGVVMTDPDGRITRFLEKPGWGEVFSDTVNTGFYLVEPEILALVPAGESCDFGRDLFPRLLAEGRPLHGCMVEGYWSDVGTLEQYRRTIGEVTGGRVHLDLPGRIIAPGVRAGEGTEIHPEAVVESPVLLGEYCSIGRGARIGAFSVLGDYSLVAPDASLKRAVLWRHVYVGRGAEVRGAVLADHVILRNGSAVYEGAIVGDGCRIGAHGVVRPGAKLWPGKNVESGSTVRGNVVWGDRTVGGLFGSTGITGIANVEFTPAYAVGLGAAFGATLGRGRRIAIASDGFPASCVLKRALSAGLLGTGLGVSDLGTATLPVVRFAVGALGLAGGVHVGLSSRDPWLATAQFLDAQGLPLTRAAERSIEQAFVAEDSPRVDAGRVGTLAYVPGLVEMYLDGVHDLVDAAAIRAAGFTVVLGRLSGPATGLLPGLLGRLGCLFVRIEGGEERAKVPYTQEELLAWQDAIRTTLHQVRGCLAVSVDNAAEELLLFDAGGRMIRPGQVATLLSLAELGNGRNVPMPMMVTASEAIVDLARQFKRQVVRTKAQRRMLLEEFAVAHPMVRGLILPAFDALVALAKLLENMAHDGRELSAIVDALPSYQRVERAVACTWEAKGRLMRRLAEDSQGKRVELTDGVRLEEERGWTLILPDGEEPFIRVYSEAETADEAEALGRFYADKIRTLQQQGAEGAERGQGH